MNRFTQAALTSILLVCASGCPQEGETQKAVPNPTGGGVAGFVGTANKVKLKTGVMAVFNAAQTYKANHGEAPLDVQDLVAEGLLTAEQAKDLWNNDYLIDGDGPTIVVLTYGADGEPGGEGANTDWSSETLK